MVVWLMVKLLAVCVDVDWPLMTCAPVGRAFVAIDWAWASGVRSTSKPVAAVFMLPRLTAPFKLPLPRPLAVSHTATQQAVMAFQTRR